MPVDGDNPPFKVQLSALRNYVTEIVHKLLCSLLYSLPRPSLTCPWFYIHVASIHGVTKKTGDLAYLVNWSLAKKLLISKLCFMEELGLAALYFSVVSIVLHCPKVDKNMNKIFLNLHSIVLVNNCLILFSCKYPTLNHDYNKCHNITWFESWRKIFKRCPKIRHCQLVQFRWRLQSDYVTDRPCF